MKLNSTWLNSAWQWKMKSIVGDLYLVASQKGLKAVLWQKQVGIPYIKSLDGESNEIKILKQSAEELNEYLTGKRKYFAVALDMEGTPFQMSVWKALLKIPYGQTTSYKKVAQAIGSNAIRAVGSANGKNPLCIIVPCHRVITSDGKIGGYSAGLKIKRALLSLEGKRISK